MNKRIISLIASLLLVALFLYAAISKLWYFKSFESQLGVSPYIKNYASILAWGIPAVEILIAGMLIYYRTRLAGLYGSFFMMLAFTVYVYLLLHFAPTIPCGCGGIIDNLSWKGHLFFNASFTALAGVGVYFLPPIQKRSQII